jgi:hypothetical protein
MLAAQSVRRDSAQYVSSGAGVVDEYQLAAERDLAFTANVPKPAPTRRYYFDSLNYKE